MAQSCFCDHYSQLTMHPSHWKKRRCDLGEAKQIRERIEHEHYTSQPSPYAVEPGQMNDPRGANTAWSYSGRQSTTGPIYEHQCAQRQDTGQHWQLDARSCLDYGTEVQMPEWENRPDKFHCRQSAGVGGGAAGSSDEGPSNGFVPNFDGCSEPI